MTRKSATSPKSWTTLVKSFWRRMKNGGQVQLPKFRTRGLFPFMKSSTLHFCPSVETSLQFGAAKPTRAVFFRSLSSMFKVVVNISQLHQEGQKFSWGTRKCLSLYFLIMSWRKGSDEAIRIRPIVKTVRITINGCITARGRLDSMAAAIVLKGRRDQLMTQYQI